MSTRRLPVRPNLDQLHRQAKDFLHAIHTGDPNAIAELKEHHPESIDPSATKLAAAQLALARSYDASSWTRLIQAVQLADAIWRDDLETVRDLIERNPALIREHVLVRTDSNWGPLREYRDVTPVGWGEQYHAKIFVSRESLRMIEAQGGGR